MILSQKNGQVELDNVWIIQEDRMVAEKNRQVHLEETKEDVNRACDVYCHSVCNFSKQSDNCSEMCGGCGTELLFSLDPADNGIVVSIEKTHTRRSH